MPGGQALDPDRDEILCAIIAEAGQDGITSGALYRRYKQRGNHDYSRRRLHQVLVELAAAGQCAGIPASYGQHGHTTVWFPPGVPGREMLEAANARREVDGRNHGDGA